MASARPPRAKLELFVERVDIAVNRRAVTDKTVRAKFSMRFDTEKTTISTDTGDEEDLRSLLMDFRSFLSPKEDVGAAGIFNILEQRLTDDELKAAARQNRADWRTARLGTTMAVLNDKKYRPEDSFNLITNATLFHTDAAKEAEYKSLPPAIRMMMTQQMVALTIGGLKILHPTRNIVVKALADDLLDFGDQPVAM